MRNQSGVKASFVETIEQKPTLTEAAAIAAIVETQKANGDPIDPAGAKRLLRALTAIGLFKPA